MGAAEADRNGVAPLDPGAWLSGTSMSDAGRHHVTRDRTHVGIRPFPFPFVAGLALADPGADADGPTFEEARAFVNGSGSTPYGQGLGLEVGANIQAGIGRKVLSGRRLDLARGHWLDSLSFEDAADGFAGVDLSALLEELERLRASPKVLLPGETSPTEKDLACMSAYGVHYRAAPDLLERDVFGDHLDHRHDDALHDAMRRYDWDQWNTRAAAWTDGRRSASFVGRAFRRGRKRLSSYFGRGEGGWGASREGQGARSREQSAHDQLLSLFNRVLQEGWSANAPRPFKRYRGLLTPSLTTFPAQLRSSHLDALEAGGGAVIVGVRLDLWTLIGRAQGHDSARPVGSPALDAHAVSAFRDLARRRDAGTVLVATTARLLDLLARREDLRLRVDRSRTRWTVTLDSVAGPSGHRPIVADDLNGLALLVPASAPETVVEVTGRANPLALTREPDPAHRGLHAIYAPWTPLEWPSA